MNILTIAIIAVGAVVANWILRRVIRKLDSVEGIADGEYWMQWHPVPLSSAQRDRLSEEYGKKSGSPFDTERSGVQIHPTFLRVFDRYEYIAFDEHSSVIRRSLFMGSIHAHIDYVQIGEWGEGSEILVRKNSDDPCVYIADVEGGGWVNPAMLAGSFGEYFDKAWRSHEELMAIDSCNCHRDPDQGGELGSG